MIEGQALAALSALSEATRMHILRFLVGCGDEGANAGQIGAEVGASSSRCSFHLAALAKAGLVTSQKVSRQVVYRADLAAVGSLLGFLIQDCCGGHPDILKCCAPRRATGQDKE